MIILKLAPFIAGCILAVVLSFLGPAQAMIGGVIVFLAALISFGMVVVEEAVVVDTSASTSLLELQLDSAKLDISRSEKHIRELNQRMLAVESRQSGSDPFGG